VVLAALGKGENMATLKVIYFAIYARLCGACQLRYRGPLTPFKAFVHRLLGLEVSKLND